MKQLDPHHPTTVGVAYAKELAEIGGGAMYFPSTFTGLPAALYAPTSTKHLALPTNTRNRSLASGTECRVVTLSCGSTTCSGSFIGGWLNEQLR